MHCDGINHKNPGRGEGRVQAQMVAVEAGLQARTLMLGSNKGAELKAQMMKEVQPRWPPSWVLRSTFASDFKL